MPERLPLRILLVGASGVFGSRLVERLALEPGLALTLSGRRREPLEAIQSRIDAGAVRIIDRDVVEPQQLAGYDLVIDAAGPFQGSGTALVEAAVNAGLDYLDLADGREWVVRFRERFEATAREANVVLMTGASSIPALSHAVIDELATGLSELESIKVGIFPGNRAPRGLSVVEAILSYAGKPVSVFSGGAWRLDHGWGNLHRVDAGPAGRRWASVCDTPEQLLLVRRYRPTRDAEFFAGLELSLLHLGLWALSLPVRWGWAKSLRPLARPLLQIAQWLQPFGSDRGAMTIDVCASSGEKRTWRLNAEANRGPHVPILAALAMVRRLRDGQRPGAGAYICSGILTLAEFEPDFAALGITTVTARKAGGKVRTRYAPTPQPK